MPEDYDFVPEPEPLNPVSKPEPSMDVTPLVMDADFLFLTGEAGTGKTTVLQHARKQYPGAFEVTATTGVAAMNADAITINSFLGYGTNKELDYLARSGRLRARLEERCSSITHLVIDEISMQHAGALDLLVNAIKEINEDGREVFLIADQEHTRIPLRLVVVGDFAQLPPVAPDALEAPWAFKAKCWPEFQVQKLTEVYRQQDPRFREAIQAARQGNGTKCIRLLQDVGVRFVSALEDELITLFATNAEVMSWNTTKFARLVSDGRETKVFGAMRFGRQRTEWVKEIPDTLTLCVGCRVRITANDTLRWNYVNGDQGVIEGFRKSQTSIGEAFIPMVRLDRSGRLVEIARSQRFNDIESDEIPEMKRLGIPVSSRTIILEDGAEWERPYIGSVNYVPLKYGWASTVHSVQGLSLDRLQISPMHKFFGSPNLAYVALSRAKNAEGLIIHGIPGQLSRKIVSAKEVQPWI